MLFSGILKIGESIGVRLGDHGGSTSNRGFTSSISRESHLNKKNLAGGRAIETLAALTCGSRVTWAGGAIESRESISGRRQGMIGDSQVTGDSQALSRDSHLNKKN